MDYKSGLKSLASDKITVNADLDFMIRLGKSEKDIQSVEDMKEMEYLNDVRVYKTQQQTWHGIRAKGLNENGEIDFSRVPPPRYGRDCTFLIALTSHPMFISDRSWCCGAG